MKTIYKSYSDTEVVSLSVEIECPYCGNDQSELDATDCGETYIIECEECGKEFEMYFDAD